MNMTPHNRLDPSSFDPEQLEALNKALARPGHVALIDEEGQRTELPAPLFHQLERMIRLMVEKRAIMVIPEDETFTTQAAANYLGVSRQYLVNLLKEGRIPYRTVGSHRRIVFKDLLTFETLRDQNRRTTLNRLMKQVDEAGLYDSAYTGEE
jgi:excisionase family DNA binding protein